MRRFPPSLVPIPFALLCVRCTHDYHPEYHPQVTYAYTRVYNAPPEAPSPVAVVPAPDPSARGCSLGRAAACWNECFHESRGWSCELLGVMFRTGEGVFPNPQTADHLHARACALGACAPNGAVVVPAGEVTSPGNVFVNGDVYGPIVVGR
jgi:hypothetical protein